MLIRRFAIILLSIGFSYSSSANSISSSALTFFAEVALGQQHILTSTTQSSIPGDFFIPYDRKDIMESVSLGYYFFPFLSLKLGATFFAGMGYKITPMENSINYSLTSVEVLLKAIFSYQRWHFYVMGGPALVYSNVGGFHVFYPNEPAADEFGPMIPFEMDGHWQPNTFIRPEVGAGLSVDLTPQIAIGALYTKIIGRGSFSSYFAPNVAQQAELWINPDYLPSIEYWAATLTFLF